MLTPPNAYLYELGVRIGQCRRLHDQATRSHVGPDDVALLRWCHRRLQEVFAEFAAAASLGRPVVSSGKALIITGNRLWKRWAKVPVERLVELVDDLEKYTDCLDRLEEILEDALKSASRTSIWFELGKQIIYGDWCSESRADRRSSPVKMTTPEGYKLRWEWNDRDVLQQLLRSAKLSLARVFPEPTDKRTKTTDLPLRGSKYQPWQRIEDGVADLRAACGCRSTPRNDAGVPVAVGAATREPMTGLQQLIWAALDGQALKKEPLAAACNVESSRLYRPGGIKELKDAGMVRNKPGAGYFRPDAPPPKSIISPPSAPHQ